MNSIIYKEESYAISGAIIEVSRELGCGFLERVYQDALELEFRLRNIPYEREKLIQVMYKGYPLGVPYRADFLCYGKIIVELKAVEELTSTHRSQVLNYLHATKMKLCLLVNFGEQFSNVERLLNI